MTKLEEDCECRETGKEERDRTEELRNKNQEWRSIGTKRSNERGMEDKDHTE